MLNLKIRNPLLKIVGKERLLEKPEELACYSYDAYFEEAMGV